MFRPCSVSQLAFHAYILTGHRLADRVRTSVSTVFCTSHLFRITSRSLATSASLAMPDTSNAADPAAGLQAARSTSLKPRNIVILLDGTGNRFSAQNSNVIKLMSVLQADEEQLLYYSSGVGQSCRNGPG